MRNLRILSDPDVRRSAAYLGISLVVSGIKVAVERFRNRRNGG